MRLGSCCRHPRACSWAVGFLSVMLLVAAGFLLSRLSAQGPAPKTGEEEYLKTPKKPTRRIRVEEPKAGLAGEAERATDPLLRKLYQDFAVPHDVVYFKSGRPRNVAPIPQHVGSPPNFKGFIELTPYDEKWQPGTTSRETADKIMSVDPYEHLALRAVEKLLAPEANKQLPRLDKLRAAENVLGAVVSFDRSAHERGLRQGHEWEPLEKQVREQLMDVQLEQVGLLVDGQSWEAAYELAARLAEAYPKVEKVQRAVARLLAQQVDKSLDAKDYVTTQRRLALLEAQFPNSREAEAIRQRLSKKAAELFEQAQELSKQKRPTEALAKLAEAENIWPRLPGLHDYHLKLSNAYPTLRVGVHKLPENLSPFTATTDAERQAVELIFEGLLKPGYESEVGQRYYPALAVGRPELIPLGRKFELARDAYWANGERVTAADVRQTVKLLKLQGRASLLLEARPGEDAFHVSISLEQGFLDPLSLMTFKILPAPVDRLDDPKFARQPLGSGPFEYHGRVGDHALFVANPNYRRQGKAGLPRIREVHFLHSADPADDFGAADRRLDLLLDLPTAEIQQVRTVPGVIVQTLRNRRIYFLAVNHRRPALQNQDLRRAIAHAIDRVKALNDFFRGDLKDEPLPHRPLNGPYPPDTWAYNPKPMPFDQGLAKQLAASARKAVGPKKLSLKYPADDLAVQKACEYIRDQVHGLGAGIELELEPRAPAQLREEVEVLHEYDLAYYHWDYPSDDYWLWPLFDPSEGAMGAGGPNFLGYHDDPDLESQFRQANGHRDFKQVQKFTHTIHALIYDKMPFIPLWQLDTHIAYHKDLKPVRIDPLLIFPDVEDWTLDKR